jgi:thiamine biosynthesis lipoprotein
VTASLRGILLVAAAVAACGHSRTPYVARVRETRGVLISVAAWGPDSQRLDHAVTAALDSAAAVETALAGVSDRPGTQGVSPGLARLVLRAVELARASGGAFDPTAKNFRALSVDTVRHTITLAGGLHLDLGEVGRGYALDRALAALHGVADSAVISSGGQYLIHSDWSGARVVGIVDPNHTLAPLATLTIPAGTWAVSTMSVAEAGDELLDPRLYEIATNWAGFRDDLLHARRIEALALDQDVQRVERRLDGRADRPLLDVGAHDLEPRAERLDDHPGAVLRHEPLEEVVGAGEDVVHAGAARLDQERRRHAVARGHAAEVERLLDVIDVALPRGEARGLLRGVGEQPPHLLRAQAGGAAGRGR